MHLLSTLVFVSDVITARKHAKTLTVECLVCSGLWVIVWDGFMYPQPADIVRLHTA